MINRDSLLAWPFETKTQSYTRRDTILYALSLGFGVDPVDAQQLKYVLEDRLCVFPTQALVLAHPGPWTADPATGVDRTRVVHGEQCLTLHRALPPEGTVYSRNRVTAVLDKGAGKGAAIQTERDLHDAVTGELLATIAGTTFCRGDGGFEAAAPGRNAAAQVVRPDAPQRPDRPHDLYGELPTFPQSALLYRLNGDYNPIHSHPESAQAAGFERPISHGLLSFGLAARILEKAYAPLSLASIRARFAAPMYPGETLRLEMWSGPEESVWFRGICKERDKEVLSQGYARLRTSTDQ